MVKQKRKRVGKPKIPTKKHLEDQVQAALEEHKRANKDQTFTVSKERFAQVSYTVKALYVDCWNLGIELGDIRSIKQKHLRKWLEMMNKRRTKPSTLKEYCKRLQVWFTWLGKPELMDDPVGFVDGNPKLKKHRHKPMRKLRNTLVELLERKNKYHAKKDKVVSFETQHKRKTFYKRFYQDLHEMGYRLTKVHNLKQKHIIQWLLKLEAQGVKPGTLQGYVSYLRTLCVWLDKTDMMVDPLEVLKDPGHYHRVLVSNEDKTPTNENATQTVEEIIVAVDAIEPLIADQLRLADAFGLRFREMMQIKPHVRVKGDHVDILDGTKGGRLRTMPIVTDKQRTAVERIQARAVSKKGSTIPKGMKSHQWENRIRYVFKKVGFTKEGCGFTPHGLRHGFINRLYTEDTGMVSRAQGGDLAGLVAADDREARLRLSRLAGHSRAQITNCYLGSNVPVKNDPLNMNKSPLLDDPDTQ